MSGRLWVSTRKGLFGFQRDGSQWRVCQTAFIGDPVVFTLPDPRSGRLYAALNLGHFGVKLHASPDGGRSWEELPAPAYPSKPEDADSEDKVPWKLELLWCLESGGHDRPGRLWAGTIPGGLFRSDDDGASWHLVRSLWDRPERRKWFGGGYDHPGIHSVCVDPRDSDRLLVGVSCGGNWISRDAGRSWQCRTDGMYAEYMPPENREDPDIQDPHRVVQCPSNPDGMWVQHHNGIFRSRDSGHSWTSIREAGPSTFGFAVAVHPHDADTAWFVPAVKDECRVPVEGRFVVTRTRDGGSSFQVLQQGLPPAPAYHLVYRHALDVDSQGQWLAMGSTTGGLWVSADQGDSWTALSTHLPPVYAVRFQEQS
ncbi:MAG TPA: exo-alpha-sialidase [Acidobacteriota bacterium]|nr:exo-alpha-sialidase [Acidobacteriota bacterium]